MKDLAYDTKDKICALATPWGMSALAVIRCTGEGCVEALADFFHPAPRLRQAAGGTALVGWLHSEQGEKLDQVVATVWRAPHSYTGQDSVELTCHGSMTVVRRVLDELTRTAFRPAGPGEFTLRAFLAGKVDLTRAEAVHELVASKTDAARSQALHRLGGSVETRIRQLRTKLMDVMAAVNIQLDYAEDEADTPEPPYPLLHDLLGGLESLALSFKTGRVYQEGLKIVLAGRTNAGKASLFNAFLKEDRSIVSDEHGTTRDFIEAWADFDGIPARLFDTAGLREAENRVEQEGIRRSQDLLASSDLSFYLVDGTLGLTPEDEKLLKESTPSNLPRALLWTKIDLPGALPPPPGWLGLSAVTGQGLSVLTTWVQEQALPEKSAPDAVVIDSLRQKQLLDRAISALKAVLIGLEAGFPVDMVALDVQDALQALGEIVGEVTNADILNHMFGNFCVGK